MRNGPSMVWLVGLLLASVLVGACGGDDTDSATFDELDPDQQAVVTDVCEGVTERGTVDDIAAEAVTAGESGVSAFEDLFGETSPEDREGDAFINQASTICAEIRFGE